MSLLSETAWTGLEACKRLLCVEAHPGELELAAGGTIAKLAQDGCKIFFLTVTDGSKSTLDASISPLRLMEERRQEALAAGQGLGVTEHLFFDDAEGDCPPAAELCKKIIAVIRALRPEMVLSMDPFRPYEFHPDRIAVSMAAAQAALLSGMPHYHKDTGRAHGIDSIVFHTTNTPNVFVDIENTIGKKREAVFLHATQARGREPELNHYIDHLSFAHKSGCGFERSEAFFQLPARLMPLHFQI